MTGVKKSIDSLELKTRKDELSNINTLYNEFGDPVYLAVDKYFTNTGYEAGFERIVKLLEKKEFSKKIFLENPVKAVENHIHGFFADRGGNMPDVWSENNTVFLKTEKNAPCITTEAEKEIKVFHKDICQVYCRSFVKGFVKVFEDLFPGILINFYNASSRREKDSKDCIEAFQVIVP